MTISEYYFNQKTDLIKIVKEPMNGCILRQLELPLSNAQSKDEGYLEAKHKYICPIPIPNIFRLGLYHSEDSKTLAPRRGSEPIAKSCTSAPQSLLHRCRCASHLTQRKSRVLHGL